MTEYGMNCAYLDCFSGISGDMFLSALLDAGLSLTALEQELTRLQLDGFRLKVETATQDNIRSTRLTVETAEHHPHRSWQEIRRIIMESDLATAIKEKSLTIFTILAEAEAKIHGCPVDEVHFHEVGGVDAMVDIVGVVAGLIHLGIDTLITSPLPIPRGWVNCAHGALPVPAPAVCEILKDVPVYGVDLDQEMVTPTGAAIVKGLSRSFGPFPAMIIRTVGYGAGSRVFANQQPNLVRLVLGRKTEAMEQQTVEVIETNLDDWSPEGFPYLCDRLLTTGALDVNLVPIQMKKGRPGFLLRIIAPPALAWELKRTVLSETTAIGLRYRQEQRWTLPRESGFVDTQWGPLQVKKVETPGGTVLYPEYEDCRRIAQQHGLPLQEVYRTASRFMPADFRRKP